uniref:Pentatricopeptide repeat-containing protein n=1 Tax=Kalanchoe fedtschenkoi TaxID=63787 RepID=A0A7N0VIV8_KALFE
MRPDSAADPLLFPFLFHAPQSRSTNLQEAEQFEISSNSTRITRRSVNESQRRDEEKKMRGLCLARIWSYTAVRSETAYGDGCDGDGEVVEKQCDAFYRASAGTKPRPHSSPPPHLSPPTKQQQQPTGPKPFTVSASPTATSISPSASSTASASSAATPPTRSTSAPSSTPSAPPAGSPRPIIASGSLPDERTSNVLTARLLDAKLPDYTFRFVRGLVSGNPDLAPSLVNYNRLMHQFCCIGPRPQLAHGLFFDMVGRGHRPNTVSYATLIDGYCQTGDLDSAHKVFDEMLENGVAAHSLTCSLADYHCTREPVCIIASTCTGLRDD